MRAHVAMTLLFGVVLLMNQPAAAQQPFYYPAQGQTQDQQNRDFGECHAWAVQQTGFNPLAQQAAPQKEAAQGGLLRGAARGAAVGAVGGAIAGDAGKGAAIGAGGGALIGNFRRNDQRRKQDRAQQQYQQQQAQGRNAYDRATGACMKGRGYSVN